jgi:hypothetical protein
MNIKCQILFLGMFSANTLILSETLYTSAATLSSSGSKATNSNYSDEATVGEIVGTATGASVSMKSGFTRPDLRRKTFFYPHSPISLPAFTSLKHRS